MLFGLPVGSSLIQPCTRVCPRLFYLANLDTDPALSTVEPRTLTDMTVLPSSLNPGHGGPPHAFMSAGHQPPNVPLSLL